MSRVSYVSAGRKLEENPSLNRFASGKRWNTETADDVPRNVERATVETRSTWPVYVSVANVLGRFSA